MPYDDGASPLSSGSFDEDLALDDGKLAVSDVFCTPSMAEDASFESGAGCGASKEAAGVEFLVEEALLVDPEGATSDAAPG